jgi:hypothetical protein
MKARLLCLIIPAALCAPVPRLVAALAAADGSLQSTRALAQRLVASGRGETTVSLMLEDPMGGPPRVLRGTLALEPPDRVRLDFATGERIAVRGDGGEWLQPAQRQLIRLRSEQAGFASWLWDLFLKGGRGRFRERAAVPRHFLLTAAEAGTSLPDTVMVAVDGKGLPVSLEIHDATLGATVYRFSGWKFTRARGPSAFELRPPSGYTVVEEAVVPPGSSPKR